MAKLLAGVSGLSAAPSFPTKRHGRREKHAPSGGGGTGTEGGGGNAKKRSPLKTTAIYRKRQMEKDSEKLRRMWLTLDKSLHTTGNL